MSRKEKKKRLKKKIEEPQDKVVPGYVVICWKLVDIASVNLTGQAL